MFRREKKHWPRCLWPCFKKLKHSGHEAYLRWFLITKYIWTLWALWTQRKRWRYIAIVKNITFFLLRDELKSIRGSWGVIWGPFQGSLTHLGVSRGLLSQKQGPLLAIFWPILTFPDPPCQPGQFFLVQNGLYMCPTYSTTCFMLKSHLWGVF